MIDREILETGALAIAIEDYDTCRQALTDDDSQFWRRAYVRSAFVAINSLVDFLRDRAIEATAANDSTVQFTKLHLLGPSDFRILRNGKLEMVSRREAFMPYTAFVLRSLAEELGTSIDEQIGNAGWEKLGGAVKVRDRITHPKLDTDMTISDDELNKTEEGFLWFWNTMVDIFFDGAPDIEDAGEGFAP